MAIDSDLFEIVETKEGSGWKALRVIVKWIHIPDSLKHKENVVTLTNDILTIDEFNSEIDDIIQQLENLKKKAKRKINKIEKHNATR